MRLVAATLLSLALLAVPASAQDTPGIFGLLGLGEEEPDAITYLERPPLVVPKGNALPPPAEFDKKAAAWPKDPEVLAAARRKLDRRKTLGTEVNGATAQLEFIKSENKKRQAKIDRGEVQTGGFTCTLFGNCVIPDKPRQGVQPENVETVTASGEPVRQYLTDPPSGLRVPAPEPAPGTN